MQFAVVGNPISHSCSPLLHNSAFIDLGIRGAYGRYLLDESKNFSALKELGLNGANITIPFKEVAFNNCDFVHGIAQKIGVVNTIIFKDSKLHGYNTDADGFFMSLDNEVKSALIIGAGGSSKALAHILKDNNIKITIINRSKYKLESFIKSGFESYVFEDYIHTPHDAIINTTPSSLNKILPMDKSSLQKIFESAKIAYDLLYGIESPFLRLAHTMRLKTKDGKEMLVNQAILAFEIFMDRFCVKYDKKALRDSMYKASLLF